MQTTAQIDFQGLEATDQLRNHVARRIAMLEDRFGRITSCRVVVKGPGAHHQTGGLHEVNIHLSLPDGREVSVERTPKLDERHGRPLFAINDAFNRARRRLQDHVRRMRGQVKQHEDQPIATVKQLSRDAGFGFLEAEDGHELYFHRNSVIDDAFPKLQVGTRVAFAEEMGDNGPQASTVRLLGKHGLR
jgi:cold shock CspA family protein